MTSAGFPSGREERDFTLPALMATHSAPRTFVHLPTQVLEGRRPSYRTTSLFTFRSLLAPCMASSSKHVFSSGIHHHTLPELCQYICHDINTFTSTHDRLIPLPPCRPEPLARLPEVSYPDRSPPCLAECFIPKVRVPFGHLRALLGQQFLDRVEVRPLRGQGRREGVAQTVKGTEIVRKPRRLAYLARRVFYGTGTATHNGTRDYDLFFPLRARGLFAVLFVGPFAAFSANSSKALSSVIDSSGTPFGTVALTAPSVM